MILLWLIVNIAAWVIAWVEAKKFKMAESKKLSFWKSQILKKILWKFNALVFGLVGLIDAKGIDGCKAVQSKRQPKNAFIVFFMIMMVYSQKMTHTKHSWRGVYAFMSWRKVS